MVIVQEDAKTSITNACFKRSTPGSPNSTIEYKTSDTPEAIKTIAEFRQGLVLVTGPTGSGKSTTLAAIIDYLNNTRDGHIITIEDPLEFVHPNKKCLFSQREIGAHARSFAEQS